MVSHPFISVSDSANDYYISKKHDTRADAALIKTKLSSLLWNRTSGFTLGVALRRDNVLQLEALCSSLCVGNSNLIKVFLKQTLNHKRQQESSSAVDSDLWSPCDVRGREKILSRNTSTKLYEFSHFKKVSGDATEKRTWWHDVLICCIRHNVEYILLAKYSTQIV